MLQIGQAKEKDSSLGFESRDEVSVAGSFFETLSAVEVSDPVAVAWPLGS